MMRALLDMDTIQIELTNACIRSCSNCTRFCGHQKPYYMSWHDFKRAVHVMKDYPKMTGFMGGEPLLHPNFERYCEWVRKFIPPERLGLWTSLPPGKEHLAPVICDTFKHIFINDHSRADIYHAPILVASKELYKDEAYMYYIIDHCWLQNSWSASINPTGAYFCEIAASMALLFDIKDKAWKVEEKWWTRTPKDFKEQIEEFCPKCGVCAPLSRRLSIDGKDDISPENLQLLKDRSLKVQRGEYEVSNLKVVQKPEPMASYKDTTWRNQVAARYGTYLTVNNQNFWAPLMLRDGCKPRTSIYDELKEKYNAFTQGEVEENVSLECSRANQ